MYKKITHDIREEHYDHPASLPAHMQAELIQPSSQGSLPSWLINEQTMLFRMDSRTAWSKWAFSLLNYSISLNGDLPGTDQVKGRVNKNAMILGDFLVPYYGLTAGNTFASALISINDVGMHYVNALKEGKPTDNIVELWEPLVYDIGKIMSELNPVYWPDALICDMFKNLVLAWQQQLTARTNGDIVADEIAIDHINKIVVTGLPNHIRAGYSSIADTFSRGIIAQFPDMFMV